MAKKTAACDTKAPGKKGGMATNSGKMKGKMAPPFKAGKKK